MNGKVSKTQVLNAIKNYGPISAAELSDYFSVSKNSIRSHIADIRSQGWTINSEQAGDGTATKLYTYGGKPTKTDGSDMLSRCYFLVRALRECRVNDVMKNLGVSKEEAIKLLTEVSIRNDHELEHDIIVRCKEK